MHAYRDLIDRVLTKGTVERARNCSTLHVFGEEITFDLTEGFPIVTLRKIDYIQAIGELTGFLRGYTTKSQFNSVGCHYWNSTGGMANDELGPIYGAQWNNFFGINQLKVLLENLHYAKFSRRHILTTWNPAQLNDMVLPPCHIIAQFHVREDHVLDCIVYMRSVDIMLGLPYDIIIYALLVHILAHCCNMFVGTLKFTFGNTHIYTPHIMEAVYMIKYDPLPLSQLLLDPGTSLLTFDPKDVIIAGYASHKARKFELFL